MPPAHIVVAGLDPLRDEGVRFAGRLNAAGVTASLVEAPTLTHGFVRKAPYVAAARAAVNAMSDAVAAAMNR